MSSSKIQEYNLDPNMGLAKESTSQEILKLLKDKGKVSYFTESDDVLVTLLSSEVTIPKSGTHTFGEIYIKDSVGSVKVTFSAKYGASGSFKIYKNGELYSSTSLPGDSGYVTQTVTLTFDGSGLYKFYCWNSNQQSAVFNLLTISGSSEETTIDEPITVL